MKYLLLTLALLLIGCNKDTLEPRPFEFGSIAFSVSPPKTSTTAKVPSCKDIEPNEVRYNLTNDKGQDYTYTAPISLVGNKYISNPTNTLPFGNYTINNVSLINGNDTIYALPTIDELDLSPYWDTTLPMDIIINGDETVSGTVFCYNEYTAPDLGGVINGGFEAKRLQSLWFAIYYPGCVNRVEINIDGFNYPSISTTEEGLYEAVIPLNYSEMTINAYGVTSLSQSVVFNSTDPYNPDGEITLQDVIVLTYNCP